MNVAKIIFCLAVLSAQLTNGQQMSEQWSRENERSWEQARAHFPESARHSAFKTRMQEINGWAKDNNTALYYNSNKPLLIAKMVQREIDIQATAATARQPFSETKPQEPEQIGSRIKAEGELAAWIAGAVLLGFGLSRNGVSRSALWGCLIILAFIVALTKQSSGGMMQTAAVAYASVVGMRAKNAGYSWWLAGLTALPLISIPFVIHLLFRKGNALSTEEFDQKWLSQSLPITPVSNKASSAEPSNIMYTEFEVEIPEGKLLNDGYVEMRHNTQYTLNLRNLRQVPCDAEIIIDGTHVGTWRVNARDEIRIERPVHDTGHFTFFEVETKEAEMAGISRHSDNGLISVTFKPERAIEGLEAAPLSRPDFEAGATGLTGHSHQRFSNATEIEHDMTRAFTIHLRLVSRRPDIRPLAPRSTPIPPPVE